jgi:hypothetical protein
MEHWLELELEQLLGWELLSLELEQEQQLEQEKQREQELELEQQQQQLVTVWEPQERP